MLTNNNSFRELIENEEATQYFPDFRGGCSSGLYNQRHAKYPPLPQSIFDLMFCFNEPDDLPEDVNHDFDYSRFKQTKATKETKETKKFLQEFSIIGENCYLLYACDDDLARLASKKTWFVDATFSVVPTMFYQLFTPPFTPGYKVLQCLLHISQ